jgi:hypothetical protein
MADFDGPCEIRRAGVTAGGEAQLDLKAADGTFDWHWFLSADNLGREMLAVALAAMAANRQVDAAMTLPAGGADPSWTKVDRLFLI